MTARPLAAIAALSLFLSACTGLGRDGGYPSLAKRAAEGEAPGAGAVNPQSGEAGTAAPAEPELMDRLAGLSRQGEKGKAAFDALYEEVAGRIRVSTDAAVSSENWVAAHVSLARLEQARYDSVYALAAMDALHADRMKAVAEGKARGGVAEIEAARAPLLATVALQNDRIDALKAVLREP